jgi:hypothetical protein
MKICVCAWAIAIAASAAACTDDDFPSGLPVQPQGGIGTQPGGTGQTGGFVIGRVCLITTDPRALASCASTGAQGMTVTLAGVTATTSTTGAFTLPAPTATNGLVFSVTGTTVVPAAQAFSPVNTIPALSSDLFNQILAANSVQIPSGSGSIIAAVVTRSGQPAANVTAMSTPASTSPPLFDGTTPTTFATSQTGQAGIVFFPGLTTIGPVSLTFTDITSGLETTVDGVQVFDGGITFVSAPLP